MKDWTERLDELNPDENPVLCRICNSDEVIEFDDICQDCEELS